MADAKRKNERILRLWVVDTFDEVEWSIYEAGDRSTRRLIGRLGNRYDARVIAKAHNRELVKQTERIEQLEVLLRGLIKGIDDWNEDVQRVIGRIPDYHWGTLEEARRALRLKESRGGLDD